MLQFDIFTLASTNNRIFYFLQTLLKYFVAVLVIALKRIAGYNRDEHFLENIAQSTVKRIAKIDLLLLFLALSFLSFVGC